MLDATIASISFDLIYPEIALLVAAFMILVFCISRQAAKAAPVVALAGLLVSLWYALQQVNHQVSGFSGMVTCDSFGVTFKIFFCCVSILAILMARRYFVVKGIDKPEFYALILFSTMGMMVMANTSDLIVMFLGLEIMSVPLYVMAGFARRSLQSNEAGIKYFIMGAFASAFLLMGIAFLFGASGTTDLRRIAADFSFIVGNQEMYLMIGAALTLIGFGFKVGVVPFHSWIPDVYQGAPTPVTAFFSVGPKAAGFAALLRVFTYGLAEIELLTSIFWVLAVLTMTVGNVLALRQSNIKRMLAYSSIAHAGYILVGLVVGGSDASAGAIVYLVGYALFNMGAFTVITLLETRSGCKSELSELAGMGNTTPYLAVVLALFMLALAGFPATIGFIGKFYIFSAAVREGFIWLVIIGVMNSFISVYYYFRVIKTTFFDSAEQTFAAVQYTPATLVVLAFTAAGTIGFGLFPQWLINWSKAAMFAFL